MPRDTRPHRSKNTVNHRSAAWSARSARHPPNRLGSSRTPASVRHENRPRVARVWPACRIGQGTGPSRSR